MSDTPTGNQQSFSNSRIVSGVILAKKQPMIITEAVTPGIRSFGMQYIQEILYS